MTGKRRANSAIQPALVAGIRVMHVIPWPVYGGPHNEALTLGLQAARMGWSLTVVVPRDADAAALRLQTRGIKVFRLQLTRLRRTRSAFYWLLYPLRFLIDVWRLARLMRREEVDVVEGSSVNVQAALAARLAGAGVVWRLADVSSPMILRRAVGLLVPDLADAILVNGYATLDEYPGLAKAADKVTVYYPMIDDAAFRNLGSRINPGGTMIIGMVANINPDKGIDVFVEAAGILSRRNDLQFVLVGEEHETHREYARRCHARVGELCLQSRFEFAGRRSDVADHMRHMDVFVISSDREGSTTTAIEAMASGLPVVATNVGAVGEVVANGETGLLVPPRDPMALATAVQVLLDDKHLRARFAIEGRRRFEHHFAMTEALSTRASVYGRVAENSTPSREAYQVRS